MILSQELCDALNAQASIEFKNMNLYMQMSAYFGSRNLFEMAEYFDMQAETERMHGRRILEYVGVRGGAVTIGETTVGLSMETDEWLSGYRLAELAELESLNDLYRLALEVECFVDIPFISEMITSQVLEVSRCSNFLSNFSKASDIKQFDVTLKK